MDTNRITKTIEWFGKKNTELQGFSKIRSCRISSFKALGFLSVLETRTSLVRDHALTP
jgi:hypothetical protein